MSDTEHLQWIHDRIVNVYKHPLYKTAYVEPINILNQWGDSVDVSIKGGTQEVYLNPRCLHAFQDGVKRRIVIEE